MHGLYQDNAKRFEDRTPKWVQQLTANALGVRAISPRLRVFALFVSENTRKRARIGRMLDFNHAMIYSRDVTKALTFYRDLLGFEMVDDFVYDGRTVYARLRAPGGSGTIALHALEPGKELVPGAIRLYFETPDLDAFCASLEQRGVTLKQQPALMPWGWTHAYLDDPDGHEVSLYWSAGKRLYKSATTGSE